MNMPEASRPDSGPPSAALRDPSERARLLGNYGLDSLEDDPELAAIVRFAGALCEAPIALVSLVEEVRQRFLARHGIAARETPRDVSFCAHAMLGDTIMEVRNALEDERFADNALVRGEPHIRFYAGQPLVSPEGVPLGSLCVIDSVARPGGLTAVQRQGLEVLGAAVMMRLRVRREGIAAQQELEQSEARLKALADSIPDIAWSAGPDGVPNYFNKRWFEFTGIAEGDLTRNGEAVIHPDDYPALMAKWESCVARSTPFEHEDRVRRHDGTFRWMLHRAVPMTAEDGSVAQWFGTVTDIDDARKLSEGRDLLAKELSHRIKNIFAVIAGLVQLTARSRPEAKDYAEDLSQTVRALGRAHDYVGPAGGPDQGRLHGLLADLFAPYGSGEHSRVRVSGDDCRIGTRAATPLALVFHELATNSAKYGALANPHGHVDLAIADKGETLELTWTEHGGSAPAGEIREGFGTRLVEMSLSGQLGGRMERRFETDGMVAQMTVSKASIKP